MDNVMNGILDNHNKVCRFNEIDRADFDKGLIAYFAEKDWNHLGDLLRERLFCLLFQTIFLMNFTLSILHEIRDGFEAIHLIMCILLIPIIINVGYNTNYIGKRLPYCRSRAEHYKKVRESIMMEHPDWNSSIFVDYVDAKHKYLSQED